MRMTWHQAVKAGLHRYSSRHATIKIERDRFLREELARIVRDTSSTGKTPSQTVSRVLQELRDAGFLFFSESGLYTLNQVYVEAASEDLPDDVLENAVDRGLLKLADVKTSNEPAILRVRRGMSALRKRTLSNYRHICALCDVNDSSLLVASHIARWADRPDARGVLSNTVCLCTLHDKLFETGYFSMSDELELIWKSPISIEAIAIWRKQCTSIFKLPKFVNPAPQYLNEHRARVGL